MAEARPEGSVGKLLALLAVAGIGAGLWFALGGRLSAGPVHLGFDTSSLSGFNWSNLITPLFIVVWIASIVIGARSRLKRSNERARSDTTRIAETTHEPSEVEEAPLEHDDLEAAPPAPMTQSWNELSPETRSTYTALFSLLLGLFFWPIGPVIGLILLRGEVAERTTFASIVRIVLILLLVASILGIAFMIWIATAS